MTGEEFRQCVHRPDASLDQDAFNRLWPRLHVLAQCSPQDKFTIIQGCQAYRLPGDRRDIVAMTGDGTNDAPALRRSDVGFAMLSGTSIARQAADILLMDNNFSSIVSSVKWGRNVYASILKFLQFQLTINIAAVAMAVGGVLTTGESPLSPVQMLWINMIMDSLASVALATEAPSDAMLRLRPFSSATPLLTPSCVKHICGQAVYQLAVMTAILWDGGRTLGLAPAEQATFVFNTFVVMQLCNQVACRKAFDEPNFLEGLAEHRFFLGVVAAEVSLQALIVQYGGTAFGTVPLPPKLWAVSMGFALAGWGLRQALIFVPTRKFDEPVEQPKLGP
eukprot:jgi/Ulvmu1/9478/UM052_0047.1